MKEPKFYKCEHCGNIVVVVEDGKVTPSCCGEAMKLLVANTVDAAAEKHVPVVTRQDGKLEVNVGDVDHPMLEEHYINFIAVVSDDLIQIAKLHPGEAPHASFVVDGDVDVYEYCNLHGLWKA